MRHTARNLLCVADSLNKSRYIALFHLMVVDTEFTVRIAAHRVYISSFAWNKYRVLLSTADLLYNNIKAANFGQVVHHPFTANSQLAVIVVFIYKINGSTYFPKRKARSLVLGCLWLATALSFFCFHRNYSSSVCLQSETYLHRRFFNPSSSSNSNLTRNA